MVELLIEQNDNSWEIKTEDNVIDVSVFFECAAEGWPNKMTEKEAELLSNKLCDTCAIFYDIYTKYENERLEALKEYCGDVDGS